MTEIGQYDFSGSCTPGSRWSSAMQYTFSVGIFKWMPARKGKKKSAVICRVKGYISNEQSIYNFARQLCNDLNLGKRKPEDLQKTYMVKG